ncbi:MAG: isoprenylcysteine carboxylmethyltransferase family protein [Planctomycetes bacterium]|nr:isoprenylcysteine carboxylmethyltransferase family protein [Planctomycetota bacterium]
MDIETTCRLALAGILVLACFDSGYHRLRAEKQGGRVSLRNDPRWFWVVMMLAMAAFLLGTLAFLINPAWLTFTKIALPDYLRLLGIPLGLVTVILNDWMFRHLGHNVTKTSMPRDNASLVMTGPYRWIRHPMYSFGSLLFLAFALLTSSWLIAVSGIVAFFMIALRTRLEERRLIDKFGDRYRNYMRRTGRYFPRLAFRSDRPTSDAMNGA